MFPTLSNRRTPLVFVFFFLSLSALASPDTDLINGAGATLPAPLYQKWFNQVKTAHPDVQINYQDIGSGAGLRQLMEPTVDFGASDKFVSDADLAKMKIKPLHFPTVLGAVVLTYNIPGLSKQLNLTPETIVGIFLGQIKKWDDPKLVAANPGLKLPSVNVLVVHRSDGSGTSYVFTEYLAKISPEWKSRVGVNDSVNWPLGMGGKGTAGVAGLIKQHPYSIGYVELLFARQNKLAYAALKNAAGNFVQPSTEAVTAAAASVKMPDDFRVSIVNAAGPAAYPISTYTWLLIPSRIADPAKRKDLTDFLHWMLITGQKEAAPLGYAPLPDSVVAAELKQIALIK